MYISAHLLNDLLKGSIIKQTFFQLFLMSPCLLAMSTNTSSMNNDNMPILIIAVTLLFFYHSNAFIFFFFHKQRVMELLHCGMHCHWSRDWVASSVGIFKSQLKTRVKGCLPVILIVLTSG